MIDKIQKVKNAMGFLLSAAYPEMIASEHKRNNDVLAELCKLVDSLTSDKQDCFVSGKKYWSEVPMTTPPHKDGVYMCLPQKDAFTYHNDMWWHGAYRVDGVTHWLEPYTQPVEDGKLLQLKKWVDDNYPNFNKSDIESKIDELIVEDGKLGGEVEEHIVCSAIKYFRHPDYEIIVTGLRHNNCISTYFELTGDQTHDEEQGFLTSKNRFVNRIEAGKIALACGQIKELKYYGGKMLDSSDLYRFRAWRSG